MLNFKFDIIFISYGLSVFITYVILKLCFKFFKKHKTTYSSDDVLKIINEDRLILIICFLPFLNIIFSLNMSRIVLCHYYYRYMILKTLKSLERKLKNTKARDTFKALIKEVKKTK